MLIEAFEAILRDVAVALLWLGAAILGVSAGGTAALFGLGRVLRARAPRAPRAPAPLPAGPSWTTSESEGCPWASL